jgi:acetyl-CoA acetyltransferase
MGKPDIVIVAATRTPIGSFGGALKEVPLSRLAMCTGVGSLSA